jgi:3-deoxy-D-manno-octulosonate 8-phosphate phosphatase (KDO 8-P phosphatase)
MVEDKLKKITTFILDVDGVLTDGYLLISETGKFLRRMNIKDGYGIRYASDMGYLVCVISGAEQALMRGRFEKLGIKEVYVGSADKIVSYEDLKKKHDLKDEEVLFVGDDMPDIPLLKKVGFSCCPKNACQDVLSSVDHILHNNGGEGCVREVIEKVMKLQGKW